MNTVTVTPTAWLADRGLIVGSRVGSCTMPRHPYGTVIAVRSIESLTVRWDNGQTESVTWTAISPLGYTVEVGPVAGPTPSQWASAAVHFERRADWRVIRIDGARVVVLQSGRSGHVYWVRADALACDCPWYVRTGRQCSHMLALELAALEADLAGQPAAPQIAQAA